MVCTIEYLESFLDSIKAKGVNTICCFNYNMGYSLGYKYLSKDYNYLNSIEPNISSTYSTIFEDSLYNDLKQQLDYIKQTKSNPSESVLTLYKEAKEVLGEDNVDLQMYFYVANTSGYISNIVFKGYAIILKYGSYRITNTEGMYKDLLDTYVCLVYRDESKTYKMYGTSSKRYSNEFTHNYVHSHLPSNTNMFSNFCLGTGPLNTLLMEYSANSTIENAGLLLYSIETYLQWESIEGAPYYKMSDVGGKSYLTFPHQHDSSTISDDFDPYIKQLFNTKFLRFTKRGYPYIDNSKDFLLHINEVLKDFLKSEYNDNYRCYIDSEGKPYIDNGRLREFDSSKCEVKGIEDGIVIYDTKIPVCIFKNEIVNILVYEKQESEEEKRNNKKWSLRPEQVTNIANYFSRKLREEISTYEDSKVTREIS